MTLGAVGPRTSVDVCGRLWTTGHQTWKCAVPVQTVSLWSHTLINILPTKAHRVTELPLSPSRPGELAAEARHMTTGQRSATCLAQLFKHQVLFSRMNELQSRSHALVTAASQRRGIITTTKVRWRGVWFDSLRLLTICWLRLGQIHKDGGR